MKPEQKNDLYNALEKFNVTTYDENIVLKTGRGYTNTYYMFGPYKIQHLHSALQTKHCSHGPVTITKKHSNGREESLGGWDGLYYDETGVYDALVAVKNKLIRTLKNNSKQN